MAIEIVDNDKDEFLTAAFDLIERKIKEGHHFTNRQRDIGIMISVDALPPGNDRDLFYEYASMNKLTLWQLLWGQWRRCLENGTAQAPVIDPGWDGEREDVVTYGLGEATCPICSETFERQARGQIYDKNECGVEAERRARGIVQQPVEQAVPQFTPPPLNLDNLSPFAKLEVTQAMAQDDSDSVRLDTDFVQTE